MCNSYKLMYKGVSRPEAWLVDAKQTVLIKRNHKCGQVSLFLIVLEQIIKSDKER